MTALYTYTDFLRGRPERLFAAAKSPKILLTWQHGDEPLGPKLGYHLYANRPDLLKYVDYLCGNPLAAEQAGHWIDTDLNRSYRPAGEPNGYEENRAKEILEIIQANNYKYVIDLHTSVTDVDRFIIVYEDNPTVRTMIAASSESRVVMLSSELYLTTLMGQLHNCIAFEYNQAIAQTPEAIDDLVAFLENLISGSANKPKPRDFFHIDGVIPKGQDPGPDVRNFEWCDDGYYPVMFGVGERSYRNDPTKNYLGWAARRKETIEL